MRILGVPTDLGIRRIPRRFPLMTSPEGDTPSGGKNSIKFPSRSDRYKQATNYYKFSDKDSKSDSSYSKTVQSGITPTSRIGVGSNNSRSNMFTGYTWCQASSSKKTTDKQSSRKSFKRGKGGSRYRHNSTRIVAYGSNKGNSSGDQGVPKQGLYYSQERKRERVWSKIHCKLESKFDMLFDSISKDVIIYLAYNSMYDFPLTLINSCNTQT